MEIPNQLKNAAFGFVLLGKWNKFKKNGIIHRFYPKTKAELKNLKEEGWLPQGKAPFEIGWTTKPYKFDNPKLLEHLNQGFNFGIICGYGNLRILDIDNEELGKDFEDTLDTFAIKTGSGGRHFYFISDYDINHTLINGLGELRSRNSQVVAAPSMHPLGVKYEVIKDLPIKTISAEELKKIIEPYLRKETGEGNYTGGCVDTSRSATEFRNVIRLIGQGATEEEVYREMAAFSKWSEEGEGYRTRTYEKAARYIQESNQRGTNGTRR